MVDVRFDRHIDLRSAFVDATVDVDLMEWISWLSMVEFDFSAVLV